MQIKSAKEHYDDPYGFGIFYRNENGLYFKYLFSRKLDCILSNLKCTTNKTPLNDLKMAKHLLEENINGNILPNKKLTSSCLLKKLNDSCLVLVC
jgi:hypothetical protein